MHQFRFVPKKMLSNTNLNGQKRSLPDDHNDSYEKYVCLLVIVDLVLLFQRHKRLEIRPRTETNCIGEAAGPTPEEGDSPPVRLPRPDGLGRVVGKAGQGRFSGSDFHLRRGQAAKTVAGVEVSFLGLVPEVASSNSSSLNFC